MMRISHFKQQHKQNELRRRCKKRSKRSKDHSKSIKIMGAINIQFQNCAMLCEESGRNFLSVDKMMAIVPDREMME